MIDKNKIAELTGKYLDGTATETEREFLEAYYNAMHSGQPIGSVMEEEQISHLEAEMYAHIQSETRKVPVKPITRRPAYTRYIAVAASLLLVSLSAWLWWRNTTKLTPDAAEWQISKVNAGDLRQLRLSDGTVVWLNAASTLRYPAAFKKDDRREVYLEGEAYFEVHSDRAHPFLVHTKGLTTTALGTRFNVRAYDSSTTEVTLEEGKVMLAAAGATPGTGDSVVLAPNERAVFAANSIRLTKSVTETAVVTAVPSAMRKKGVIDAGTLWKHAVPDAAAVSSWRRGVLVFNQESLGRVADALSRKLNVSVHVAPELQDAPVSLKVSGEPLEEILIQITRQVKRKQYSAAQPFEMPAQFRQQGSEYYIE